jgi:hypothetical protein
LVLYSGISEGKLRTCLELIYDLAEMDDTTGISMGGYKLSYIVSMSIAKTTFLSKPLNQIFKDLALPFHILYLPNIYQSPQASTFQQQQPALE